MSGPWRKVEGEYANTVGVLPFETVADAYDLTVPNTLPYAGPPDSPVMLPQPVASESVQRISREQSPSPVRPRRVRVKAIRRRQPGCDHSIMWNMSDFSRPVQSDENENRGVSLWTCFGLTGLLGSLLLAYHVYRTERTISASTSVDHMRYEWVVDDHGTLHRAQVITTGSNDDVVDAEDDDYPL